MGITAMVTYCVTKIIPTCSPVIKQYFDTTSTSWKVLKTVLSHLTNKQLLDEVEHDIMNYQNPGLCYLPKPKAEADNKDTRF